MTTKQDVEIAKLKTKVEKLDKKISGLLDKLIYIGKQGKRVK
jgi:hypothetical protein